MGRLFSWLAERRAPSLIVEVGTAFGVSARYRAEGLKAAASGGRLLTFDPNETWHEIASRHLMDYDEMVDARLGTFEDAIDSCLKPGQTIDIAFIDAIHTNDFVSRQVEILIERLAPRGLILLDDISFSDDMARCWQNWATDHRVLASVAVANRVGFLEFK
jgi:predicted O-methyltransferase YrrM